MVTHLGTGPILYGLLAVGIRDAEVPYTAFRSRPKAKQVTARLIVRRVPDLNPGHQSELFTAYRYAVFTDSPLSMLAAESAHRARAIVEQVIADLKYGPLAHLPSGRFSANSAWLVCAAIAFNLTRAAGTLASAFHAKATTGTIQAQLINIPARLARAARCLTLHLPASWPWQHAWQRLHTGAGPTATCRTHPPAHKNPARGIPQDQPAPPATSTRPEPERLTRVSTKSTTTATRWIQAQGGRISWDQVGKISTLEQKECKVSI